MRAIEAALAPPAAEAEPRVGAPVSSQHGHGGLTSDICRGSPRSRAQPAASAGGQGVLGAKAQRIDGTDKRETLFSAGSGRRNSWLSEGAVIAVRVFCRHWWVQQSGLEHRCRAPQRTAARCRSRWRQAASGACTHTPPSPLPCRDPAAQRTLTSSPAAAQARQSAPRPPARSRRRSSGGACSSAPQPQPGWRRLRWSPPRTCGSSPPSRYTST